MTAEMIVAIGALLSGLAGIISAILLNSKTMSLLEYRMDQVEKKLDSHNGYAKKFADTSEEIAGIREDIAVIKTTLDFLKGEAKK